MKIEHTLTILFEAPFWIGLFEEIVDNQMQVCKVTFGAEPTEQEVLEFLDRNWNKGICTEALRLMLDYIRKETTFTSLISSHFIDNPASGRVMEKCGFLPTGETAIDEDLHSGENRLMRVMRSEM